MSAVPATAEADVTRRLALLRDVLAQAPAGAIRLRGADWFAWVTGGIEVPHVTGCGTAEVLVTAHEACILTDAAQTDRLRAALADGFTFHIAPWAEPELHDTYTLGAAGALAVLSDRPRNHEGPLPTALRARRAVLGAVEQERYRALGRAAAEAVSEALRAARPDWTEFELAGACAHALWRRGVEPVLVLAGGEQSSATLRHPAPTAAHLGRRALLQVSARRHGLHANLARGVAFDPLTLDERNALQALLAVEATGLDAVRPGQSLAAVYHAFDAAYRHANAPDALGAGAQGGITGYGVREIEATASTATPIETGMAFTLTPALIGPSGSSGPALALRAEDTFLLGPAGLEVLTLDPGWPAATVGARARPLWLEPTAPAPTSLEAT